MAWNDNSVNHGFVHITAVRGNTWPVGLLLMHIKNV